MTHTIKIYKYGSPLIQDNNHEHDVDGRIPKKSIQVTPEDKLKSNAHPCYIYNNKVDNIISPVFTSNAMLYRYAKDNNIKLGHNKNYIANMKRCCLKC